MEYEALTKIFTISFTLALASSIISLHLFNPSSFSRVLYALFTAAIKTWNNNTLPLLYWGQVTLLKADKICPQATPK